MLYRDGRPVRSEWVSTRRRGRRRMCDLVCSAVDTDLDGFRAGGRPAIPELEAKE